MTRPGVARRADYGLDAPPVVFGYLTLGVVGLVLLVVGAAVSHSVVLGWGVWALVIGLGTGALTV